MTRGKIIVEIVNNLTSTAVLSHDLKLKLFHYFFLGPVLQFNDLD